MYYTTSANACNISVCTSFLAHLGTGVSKETFCLTSTEARMLIMGRGRGWGVGGGGGWEGEGARE